ncbi:MAG: menaquinone biosynthesis decarboxylase [Bacteroidales bacterium]|nr:menaquinone biosynthesis decarboxylase [Bacteroidales bacterium]
MSYKSLRHFIEVLESNNELIRIQRFVDPVLEIAEITDRVSKLPDGGKALLFENTGTDFPVLTNAMGSLRRMCIALGVSDLEDIRAEMNSLFKELVGPKDGLWDKLRTLPMLGRVAGWMPSVQSGRGACQEVVCMQSEIGLLPVLKCWPYDGGRFVTLPMVNTKDPITGIRNVGMYRMQIFNNAETGMHWHRHKVGARHFEEYKKLGQRMPVAVALGGDPVYAYAATAPMPDNFDEYLLAGFLRKKKVNLVKCLTVDLEVPADVDFVIEGYVDPSEELAWEGPFGDHTGFYSLADWYPRFHVTCITHRSDAVYPATIVGVPPMEDAYIAKATERIFLEPIRIAMLPELCDMNLPFEGVAHNIALVRMENAYPGHAYKVMNALWGAGQMMFNKVLVALPNSVDVQDPYRVISCIIRSVDPVKDVHFGKGPLDVLDHSSSIASVGSKLFIDATNERSDSVPVSLDEDAVIREVQTSFPSVVAVNTDLIRKGLPILFVSVDKLRVGSVGAELNRMFCNPILANMYAIVALDFGDDLSNLSLALWFVAGNIEPLRDIYSIRIAGDEKARVGVDGTRKAYATDNFTRDWPNVVVMDEATICRVDSIWNELNIGSFVVSPSLSLQKLSVGGGAVTQF